MCSILIGLVSKPRYVELNHTSNKVLEVQTYPAPDGLAVSAGKVSILTKRQQVRELGKKGAITEFSGEGNVSIHILIRTQTNLFIAIAGPDQTGRGCPVRNRQL